MNKATLVVRDVANRLGSYLFEPDILMFYFKLYIGSRFEKVEPDARIVSHPKCGRTWVRIMLLKYLELIGAGDASQPFHDKTLVQLPRGRVVKFDHHQSNLFPIPYRAGQLSFDKPTSPRAGKRVVLLVRDPRDVVVSFWYMLHHATGVYRNDLSSFIRDDLLGIPKIVAFMNLWIDHAGDMKDFFLISYEQITRSPLHRFRELLEFIGSTVDSEALKTAVAETSFEKMKRMEREGKIREPWMLTGAKDSDRSMKVRRGKVGGYLEELTAKDIRYLDDYIRNNLSPRLPYGSRPK